MEQDWSALSPDKKHEIRLQRWLASDSRRFASPEAAQAFRAREKRINDVIELKVPDRVPVYLQDAGFFPAKYTGMSFKKMMYDSKALFAAFKKTIVDFEPDMFWDPPIPVPGKALELLGCKQLKWPGGGLPENRPFQFIEGEYMKADEYDAFIDDPTDFLVRTCLPQLLGICEPFRNLPPFTKLLQGYVGIPLTAAFARPEMVSVFKRFYKAGRIMLKHDAALKEFEEEMGALGFPVSFGGGGTVAPFDVLSDALRGMRGAMLDMYRRPEKLLQAMDKITPFMISSVIAAADTSGHPRTRLTIHRGSDAFMSNSQFETFYWPGYKKIILACLAEGITPVLFCEGDITSRLKYFAELPRGKALALLDKTDMVKAKEVLGDTMCLAGLMPLSVLQTGTPDEVKAYAKQLIDVVGKGGGYIMGPSSVLDEANPALVKVWFEFSKEYGVYR